MLADRKLLSQVDFLSTVSGGGYTGSFLNRRLGKSSDQGVVGSPHGPDTQAIRYLRQNVKYLIARTLSESWGMVCSTVGGMLLNWTAPLAVVLFAAWVTAWVQSQADAAGWPIVLGLLGVLSAVSLVAYYWGLRTGCKVASDNGRRILVIATSLAALAGLGWLVVWSYEEFGQWLGGSWPLASGIAGLVAIAPAMMRFLPLIEKPAVRKIVLQILLWSAIVAVPLLALLVFYGAWWFTAHAVGGTWILALSAAVCAVIACCVISINLTGPHRLYPDALARTFVQTAEDANPVVSLHEINGTGTGPYHLINCALNLPSSSHPALRERRCDFFLFSKHWSGAPSIGYFDTSTWRANGEPLDLATAMATSGAALSAHMRLGAMPTLTALLALLNLRLGIWIKRPGSTGSDHPGFVCLLREMFGIGMSEHADWLNLSDGGHIENMAAYELLRRRCKFIVCVDGEADPEFNFGGLMTLIRHTQIDFGVRIEPRLDEIRPDPKTGISKSHFHFCRIHYPAAGDTPAGTGFLLYLKLSVTGNEPELIRRYRGAYPEFPHQTTLDQFFDEEQFEAYRQLGVHVAEGLFSRALMNGQGDPQNVPDWFRRLAGNLLLPR